MRSSGNWRKGSNPFLSANKTDKRKCLSVFVFRYLIKGIRTRALRKRHSASFLAADRRLLQSINIANQGCFAKVKNESLSYALNQDFTRCVASCHLRCEPLRRKADRKRREKQALAFAEIEHSGHSQRLCDLPHECAALLLATNR